MSAERFTWRAALAAACIAAGLAGPAAAQGERPTQRQTQYGPVVGADDSAANGT
jgi:hypothetical protein